MIIQGRERDSVDIALMFHGSWCNYYTKPIILAITSSKRKQQSSLQSNLASIKAKPIITIIADIQHLFA